MQIAPDTWAIDRALAGIKEAPGDPTVAALTFAQAAQALQDALAHLPDLQAGTVTPTAHALAGLY